MNEALWAGADLKAGYAEFHLEKMGQALQPPERTGRHAAMLASGAIIGHEWQRPLYAHFDALLAAARSIPWIIEACFGEDKKLIAWLRTLPAAEQQQRQLFSQQFQQVWKPFAAHPLSDERDISVHRIGYAQVEATISGRFGVTYTGGPAKRIPTTETRQLDAGLPFVAPVLPVEPKWTDFTINGRNLFEVCREYLIAAHKLISDARDIAARVHQGIKLTAPPT